MRCKVLITLLCLVVFTSSIYADELFLTNGDRLTIKIEQLVDGKLGFLLDLAGKRFQPVAINPYGHGMAISYSIAVATN